MQSNKYGIKALKIPIISNNKEDTEWYRYVDDIFIIWDWDIRVEELRKSSDEIKIDRNIQFTLEITENYLFLMLT